VSVTATYPLDLVRARLSVASASFERLQNNSKVANSASVSGSATSAITGAPSASTISSTTSSVNSLRANVVSGSVSGAAKSIHTSISAGASAAAAAVKVPAPVPGVWTMTLKVMREEGGVRALYRGLVPTALGVVCGWVS
jgi:solute carrier family 25 phosphate transporter 23/24/25/41